MLYSNTPLGAVGISDEYFTALVGSAVANCYGVAGLANAPALSHMRQLFPRHGAGKGVTTQISDGKLIISLHIKITYGVNISTIVENICERVKYAVENATPLSVKRIDVYVEDIVV